MTAGNAHALGDIVDGDVVRIVELDVFDAPYEGLYLAEVEFSSEEQALSYNPPVWFGEDVTNSGKYHNSRLSQGNL